VVATVTEIVPSRSRPERALVHWLVETLNQDGEAVQRLAARLVVSRRGS
jgi:acyl dehydratase